MGEINYILYIFFITKKNTKKTTKIICYFITELTETILPQIEDQSHTSQRIIKKRTTENKYQENVSNFKFKSYERYQFNCEILSL